MWLEESARGGGDPVRRPGARHRGVEAVKEAQAKAGGVESMESVGPGKAAAAAAAGRRPRAKQCGVAAQV